MRKLARRWSAGERGGGLGDLTFEMIEDAADELGIFDTGDHAHCLESGKLIQVAGTDIRYVEPHRIEHDEAVRVVIFKMALTTGWDCPRAEVMMSFRKAEDATYIAQLVGRIVRTPLARRMEGNDLLNSVMLFLPHYNRDQVQTVVERLQAEGESGGSDIGDIRDFQTLNIAKGKEDLLDIYRGLPTYAAQEGRNVAHIRRALRMALELARDGWEAAAVAVRDGLRNKLAVLGENTATRRILRGPGTGASQSHISDAARRERRIEARRAGRAAQSARHRTGCGDGSVFAHEAAFHSSI